ncbi:MAG: crotonase/enoyl-CoA hydratase family protein [Nocardioidaceae bacterium]
MTAPRRVEVEVRDRVAYVRLTRPDKLNGLDFPMLDQLVDAARGLRDDRSLRAAILLGDGPAFSSGLDFASVSKQPARLARAFVRLPWRPTNHFQRVCWEWRTLPIPVLAVLHGRCYGGALQLALAADFRFATPDCDLAVLEAKWGLVPDMTGTLTLRELVGADIAKRLTMTGETFDGRYALRVGLVTGVADDPLAEAERLVEQIITRSPDSVAASKALLNRTRSLGTRAALRTERAIQLKLLRGDNSTIARAAALAGKVAEYRPRARW